MYKLILSIVILLSASPLAFAGEAADENEALKQRIEYLELELEITRKKLAESESRAAPAPQEPEEPEKSPIRIGGAMRANHAYGDYSGRRGENIGDSDFELLRLNVDLDYNGVIGRAEYRYYDDYSMMHTAWLGYKSDDYGTLKVGIVRVPFGPGPWGVSNSWFFDQHYYVGLADDMDLGARWTKAFGDLTVDLAYYLQDEGHWDGTSRDSARYSYDPVKWNSGADSDGNVTDFGENGFEEEHQVNLRIIYASESIGDIGMSFQYGRLEGTNVDDSGADHLAVSAHAVTPLRDFSLHSQLSYYRYDITDKTPWGTGDLIPMGAFNFAWPVASEAWLPAVSLRYNGIEGSDIAWLDGVTPYIEWSSILKTTEDFNNSSLWTFGALWYWGSLYIYTDFALSDGNFFVGTEGDEYGNIYDGANDFGASGNNRWHKRFNINVGYYFTLYE
ncbi:MAG: carbohydrate porin [Candidatus Dadabacteria bacterium]|nr:carbohydrate porin [Candidatus Dadabacteria bacterium]MYC39397.1 carbohydrate porin [Candidatus Dadabacteria bacterium]